jgi:hypothetical protein
MTKWEIDVEMRVRRTLVFSGPGSQESARKFAALLFSSNLDISHFAKWESDGVNRPAPVETVVSGLPLIVAIREVP